MPLQICRSFLNRKREDFIKGHLQLSGEMLQSPINIEDKSEKFNTCCNKCIIWNFLSTIMIKKNILVFQQNQSWPDVVFFWHFYIQKRKNFQMNNNFKNFLQLIFFFILKWSVVEYKQFHDFKKKLEFITSFWNDSMKIVWCISFNYILRWNKLEWKCKNRICKIWATVEKFRTLGYKEK